MLLWNKKLIEGVNMHFLVLKILVSHTINTQLQHLPVSKIIRGFFLLEHEFWWIQEAQNDVEISFVIIKIREELVSFYNFTESGGDYL